MLREISPAPRSLIHKFVDEKEPHPNAIHLKTLVADLGRPHWRGHVPNEHHPTLVQLDVLEKHTAFESCLQAGRCSPGVHAFETGDLQSHRLTIEPRKSTPQVYNQTHYPTHTPPTALRSMPAT